MEAFLAGILENSQWPVWSALILGLMTAISPCPLATNLTAIGYISKDLENRNRVFYNGLVYTAGRAISYFGVALIIFFGASQFQISSVFQRYGEKFIGPLLIIIGLFMLGVFSLNFGFFRKLSDRIQQRGMKSYWDVLLLGIIFALAFCPYSGVLYFGMLIPLTLGSPSGLLLPVVFAVATGIPVIIFAWLLAYSVSGVGSLYNKIKIFELWFRRVIAVLFIGVGIYYVVQVYF
ncbi:MAG: aromatic aminobenezylarsenical efflux permease ArsG family transporter [Bacteroidales bacterium]|jgi:cytochrome c-type biogenesis protein